MNNQIIEKDFEKKRLKKIILKLIIAWSIIVFISLSLNISYQFDNVNSIAEATARGTFEKDKAFRFWAASHGGVYVPIDERTSPNPKLSHIKDRDIQKPDGTKLTLMNPAYMVRQISNEYNGSYGTTSRITSLKYLYEGNKPDEWETKALKSFEKGNDESYEYTQKDGIKYLRLMRPLYIEQGCLKCHAIQGYKLGDVRGGVGVFVPLKIIYESINGHLIIILIGHLVLWLLVLSGIRFFRLRELKYIDTKNSIYNELIEKEDMLLESQRISHIGSWKLDLITNELTWSDEIYRLFGIDKELLGATYEGFLHAIHPDDREMVNEAYLNSLQTKESYKITHRLLMEDGSIKYVSESCESYFNEDNQPILSIGTVQDITSATLLQNELKVQEEIMIAQSRHAAMGEMISMIAHQWRQPISVIAMGANNIMADIELDMLEKKNLKDYSKDIIDKTQELSKTIDDFRNFFRPDKELADILLTDIIDDAFSVVEKSLEHNNIEVSKEFNTEKKIITYSRELMQVIINILKNAKESIVEEKPKQRKISIAIGEKEDKIVITVCDSGGGIDEEIIDKIFDPYFSTKSENIGTGLGLYMSKTIIQKHLNGTITAYNLNNGACFEIILPLNLTDSGEKHE